jgi:hypothetical protein
MWDSMKTREWGFDDLMESGFDVNKSRKWVDSMERGVILTRCQRLGDVDGERSDTYTMPKAR